jgi:ABC-type multidrug transport system fused ATPase/permease subunit
MDCIISRVLYESCEGEQHIVRDVLCNVCRRQGFCCRDALLCTGQALSESFSLCTTCVVHVVLRKLSQARFLLSNLSGEAKPGRLLALMGPSGSGKTTLLNVLAGQLAASPSLHLSGYIYVNGQPMSQGGYK